MLTEAIDMLFVDIDGEGVFQQVGFLPYIKSKPGWDGVDKVEITIR
jgi:hypothetical protein